MAHQRPSHSCPLGNLGCSTGPHLPRRRVLGPEPSPTTGRQPGHPPRQHPPHPHRDSAESAAVEIDSQPAPETCHWTAPHPSFCRQQGGGSGFGAMTGSSRARSTQLCNYTGPRVTTGHGLQQAAEGTGTCGSTQEAKGSKAGRCSGLSRKHTGVRPEGIQTRANAWAVRAQRPAQV